MLKVLRFFFIFSLMVLLPAFSISGEENENTSSNYIPVPAIEKSRCPSIPDLNYKDFLFKQYSEDLKQYYIDYAARRQPVINFYSYTVKKSDTLFAISARCNIPYDTIATLNQLSVSDQNLEGITLLLPSAPGLFIPDSGKFKNEKPETTLEALIQKNFNDKLKQFDYLCYNINERYYIHIPDERLDQTTRAFFLDVKMKAPLDSYWLSSDYGMRTNPFGGDKQFHKGIDMASPEGTKVYACKSGVVTSIVKLDSVFGNYIVIKHPNGLSSIYAHLSKIEVSSGQSVTTGQQIGLVGKTGKVTGPHLHFEIRQNGQPTDPGAYIKR